MIYKNFLPKERAFVKNNNLYAWRESTQVQINKTGRRMIKFQEDIVGL